MGFVRVSNSKKGSTVCSLIIVCGVSFAAAAAVLAQGGEGKTVRDKVYSQEQATAGRKVYDSRCSSCHDGGIMGPELTTSDFLGRWENKTAGQLYSLIQQTMPADDPGTLSEPDAVALVAFIIRANGFPPGDTPIEGPSQLETIKFVK